MYRIYLIPFFISFLLSWKSAPSTIKQYSNNIQLTNIDSIPKWNHRQKPKPKPKPRSTTDWIYNISNIDQQPLFISDCTIIDNNKYTQKQCSDKAFLGFLEPILQQYVNDPNLETCILQTTVLRFVVNEKGEMIPSKREDKPVNCQKPSKLFLNAIPKNSVLWKAGTYKDKPVKVQIDIFIRIKKDSLQRFKVSLDSIYEVVEQMPRFPGCENITGSDDVKKQCADQKMLAFVYKHLKYPSTIRECGVEGVIVIRFVIDEYGHIQIPTVIRNIGASFGKEGIRVVNKMKELPPWTVGKKEGKPVKIQFNLPIRFRLDG